MLKNKKSSVIGGAKNRIFPGILGGAKNRIFPGILGGANNMLQIKQYVIDIT